MTRVPMIPQFRWALVDKNGAWRVANETYENERIALEVRDRCFGPEDGVEPQAVMIGPITEAKP